MRDKCPLYSGFVSLFVLSASANLKNEVSQMKEENIPLLVKNQLNKAITETIAFHKAAFVHPAANFSRKRKLDIETMIKLLISMRGGSIDKELQSEKKRQLAVFIMASENSI